MKSIIALLLGLCTVFGEIRPDVHQYNMVPDESPTNDTNLGICYGSSTTWAVYPYVVALRYTSGSACCSGSIVSMNPPVILTAAHCSGCTGAIRIGCSNPSSCTGDSYTISQFSANPGYGSPLQFSNDIAVIRLAATITTPGATTMGVPSVEQSGGTARLVGYGVTQAGSIPTQLQTAQTTIIDRQLCASIMSAALGGGTYIDNSMICVMGGNQGQTGVPTMCSGDSGGPISVGANVYGVNSWVLQGSGGGCAGCSCCSGYPQVGANVAQFTDWINGYIGLWAEEYKDLYNITEGDVKYL